MARKAIGPVEGRADGVHTYAALIPSTVAGGWVQLYEFTFQGLAYDYPFGAGALGLTEAEARSNVAAQRCLDEARSRFLRDVKLEIVQ